MRDKSGVHHWVVAVRATFAMSERNELSLHDQQVAPALAPVHHGDPATTSLRHDADLCPMKPGTDVLVVGSVHAPGATPSTEVIAGLRIASIEKELRVVGPRVFFSGPLGVGISDAVPFVQQPLWYESAYGGADTSAPNPKDHLRDEFNPVGRGVARSRRSLAGTPAHTIEHVSRAAAKLGPAGFGPICSHWLPRRHHAGTYDEAWFSHKRPLLPDDYDDRFVMSAPVDQQVSGYLYGGELLELRNLSPHGLIRVTLPKVYLTFATQFGSRVVEHRGRLVTVLAEPELAQLSMVWQTSIPVAAREADYLDVTTIDEKPYLS